MHAYIKLCVYFFFRWTGANTNPRNNAGQGAAGTDRSNVALLQSQRYPEGNPNAITPKKVGQFGVNYPAHLDTCMVTSLNFDRRFLMKLALQGLDSKFQLYLHTFILLAGVPKKTERKCCKNPHKRAKILRTSRLSTTHVEL